MGKNVALMYYKVPLSTLEQYVCWDINMSEHFIPKYPQTCLFYSHHEKCTLEQHDIYFRFSQTDQSALDVMAC